MQLAFNDVDGELCLCLSTDRKNLDAYLFYHSTDLDDVLMKICCWIESLPIDIGGTVTVHEFDIYDH